MATIMSVLGCIIDIYLFHMFFSNYFTKKDVYIERKIAEKVVQTSFVAMLILCNFIGDGDWNIIITPLLLFLYSITIFNGKIKIKLLYVFTAFCVLYGCEFLFMIIVRPDANEYKNSTYMMLLMLVIKFVSYLCILFINQMIGKKRKVQYTNIFFMYLLMPVASLFVMFVVFYSGITQIVSQMYSISLVVSFVFLFLGNVISFYAFERYSERMYETMEQNVIIVKQKKDLEFYMQIEEIDKKQKAMIHDISNYIKMINRFAQEGNRDSILELTDSISIKIEKDTLPVLCDNSVLNSLLNEKKEEAKQNGVLTDVYVEPGIMLNHVSAVDLISMLGNLFDNAIRAASEASDDKYIKAFIYMKEVGGFCVIKIINTYKDVKYLENGEFLTTKIDEGIHGIGLHSVNQIAEKYGGYLTCTVKGNVFESVLLISTDES